jgi:UDP-glucose 4-epimerase
MRILLTGASSMTGCWFARSLSAAGHSVIATFTGAGIEAYGTSLRRRRVAVALEHVEPIFRCRFGDATFLETIARERFDVLCHHGAEVTNYKSPAFDACRAVGNNTNQILNVCKGLLENAAGGVILTNSVFAGRQGAGSDRLPHISPYGLSKALTSEVFRYYCSREGLTLGEFVISNPFGPYEEPRFTSYLIRSWRSGEIPIVRTPMYVRDNIHVSLLAEVYCRFVERLGDAPDFAKYCPSGYVESQGAFAQRFAREMQPRLGISCPVELAVQTEFTEPRIRINTDLVNAADLDWDEATAWDELANYYESEDSAGA